MANNATYEEALGAVWSDREYQKKVWPGIDNDDNKLTVGDTILLLEEYVMRARKDWTEHAAPEIKAIEGFRKIASIAIKGMEQHGAFARNYNETPSRKT